MAGYRGQIIAGIQPWDVDGSQLSNMSFGWRANYLKSANTQIRYQAIWQSLNDNQEPSKDNFSAGEGDVINMVFKIYSTSIYPYADWNLISTIKKTRDIANKNYDNNAPPLAWQRFTIDISQICQDLLSYSLVPINKGTWQSSAWGGMNGGQTEQDNITETISDYNVTPNGTYRHIYVTAIPEVILANGTIQEAVGAEISFNKIAVINSVAQFEEQDIYYNLKYIIQQYSADASDATRGFMSLCPNYTQTAYTPFLKQVRTDEEAEWLYWYQRSLYNGSTDDFATKVRLKVETYLSNDSIQNTFYLSDFNSTLLTETVSNLTVFSKEQFRVCTQNLSPVYANANGKDDAGNTLINQIDSSTSYYRTHLEYETAEDNLVLNGDFSNGTTSWEVSDYGAILASASLSVVDGAVKILKTADSDWRSSFLRQTITYIDGSTYKLSFKIKDGDTTSANIYVRDVYDNSGQTIKSGISLTDSFVEHTYYFTANSNSVDISFGNVEWNNAGNGQYFFIDDVSVQENPTTIRATEYRFFGIDRETANLPFGFVRFHWLNRIGGIDSYTAKRNIMESLSISRDTVDMKSPDRTWYQDDQLAGGTAVTTANYISNTMRGGNLYKGGREVLSVNAQRSNSVYTEPLNKQTADWLEEIMTSPNVWIEMDTDATARGNTVNPFQRPSTKGYIPVIITNSDVETLNQEEGLVKFNIEYTLSHKVQTQRN